MNHKKRNYLGAYGYSMVSTAMPRQSLRFGFLSGAPNPKPYTLNPKPYYPKPYTQNPTTLNPES